MACMMIARRRASAIRALRIVERLAMASAQSFTLIAGEHDVGRFIEQGSHALVAHLGDAADIVDLAGLIATGNKTEIGTKVARAPEARRIIDGGGELTCRS